MSRFRAMTARLCAAFIYVQLCLVACRGPADTPVTSASRDTAAPHSDGKTPYSI